MLAEETKKNDETCHELVPRRRGLGLLLRRVTNARRQPRGQGEHRDYQRIEQRQCVLRAHQPLLTVTSRNGPFTIYRTNIETTCVTIGYTHLPASSSDCPQQP